MELIKKEYTINEPTEKILEQQIKDKVKVVRELDIQPIEGIKELIKILVINIYLLQLLLLLQEH